MYYADRKLSLDKGTRLHTEDVVSAAFYKSGDEMSIDLAWDSCMTTYTATIPVARVLWKELDCKKEFHDYTV
jgi:hypothetical protein